MNKLNVTVRATEVDGQWEVVEGITYHGIHVLPGQLTDGLSIPLFLQWLLRKGGKAFTPGVIHDTGYRNGLLTRAECDEEFLGAMEDNGVNKFKRMILYYGVGLFGRSAYDRS